jgi:MoxR-like ATPase
MEARAAQTAGAENRDVALLERLGEARNALESEIARRVIGQHSIVEGLLTALLADGHVLLVGVPGLAKTLLISTLAEALELNFRRIQFTPDLMPSDITNGGPGRGSRDRTSPFQVRAGSYLRERGTRR